MKRGRVQAVLRNMWRAVGQSSAALGVLFVATMCASGQTVAQVPSVPAQRASAPAASGTAPAAPTTAPTSSSTAPPVGLSIETSVTVSDNGALAPSGLEQSDVFLSVRPAVVVSHFGAGLRASGELGADLVASKNRTQANEMLPFANLRANANLIERLLFLDASLDIRQLEEDPFGARVESGSTANSETAATIRISPYVLSDVTQDLSLFGRGDLSWNRYGSDRSLDARASELTLRLNSKPRPVGGLVEGAAQDVNYPNAAVNDWRLGMLSLGPSFSVSNEFVVGFVAGVEQSTTTVADHTDPIVGARFLWLPTQRTSVVLDAKHRFFGASWNIAVQHRTPTISVALRAIREPLIPGAPTVGGSGTLDTFLDSILTARFPDPSQRQQLVSELVATRGLQTSMQGTSGAPANYAQLGQGGEVTVVWVTPRNAVTLSAFQRTAKELTRSDGEAAFVGSGEDDNRQIGATLGLNRRLTPQMSIDLTTRLSRIEGLSVREGDVTREATYQLSVARTMAPRTVLTVGAQHRRFRSNVDPSFDETSGFVALGHRF